MQDVEEGMDKKEFEKKYPGQDYDAIKKDIEDRMDEGEHDKDEKVEETTSSGSVATGRTVQASLFIVLQVSMKTMKLLNVQCNLMKT